METRAHLETQIGRMTRELGRMSHEEPWASEMLYLMQVPGCGVDWVDNPSRHRRHYPLREPESAGELFWFDARAGAERGEVAGERDHEGRATGTVLGDGGSGWRAVRADPYWMKYFEDLKKRMHTNQAIACPGGPGQGDDCSSFAGSGLVRADAP
jgi:hypothetical protein